MRHHAADGGGRKPTENQTVVWETRENGQKVKHVKDRNKTERGAAVYCAWLQDGRKKKTTTTRGLNIFTDITYTWRTTADSLAGTHPVDVPGSKSQADHRVQVEKRKKLNAQID